MLKEKIVLFCKSYDKDLYRAKRLADSVDRFNIDNISFYMSVPQKDLGLFRDEFQDNKCILLTDEEIIDRTIEVFGEIPGYFSPSIFQQLIKLEFWRMGKARNYAWIDSDSYFIKDFKISDFMYDSETPYTILEEFDINEKKKKWSNAPKSVRERRFVDRVNHIEKFKTLFDKESKEYNFGVSTPIIWSSEVLKHLYEHYLVPEGKTIFRLLSDYPCETFLYGYYLFHSKCIQIYPKKHMFKAFDYLDEFISSQMIGENEYTIAKDYFGICIQSNWALIKEKKKISERLRNRKQEILYIISKYIR